MTRPNTRSFSAQISVLTGALALTLSGCGGDGTATTTDASTGSSTAEGTTVVDPTMSPTGEPTGTTGSTGSTTADDTTVATDATDPTVATDTEGDSSSGTTEHVDDTTTASMPACDDGDKNQDESDIDCGGMVCSPCDDGKACAQNSDCAVNSCVAGVCAPASCEDGLKNGAETDLDCGGGCQPCGEGLACAAAEDCASQVCTDAVCVAANCGDGLQNGDETDIDCGGGTCDACQGDLACAVDDDCLSQICNEGVCDPTECLVDLDCQSFDGECTVGVCQMPGFKCVPMPVNEAQACEDDNLCVDGTVCTAGVCGGGTPKSCANLSDACNAGVCNPDDGQCFADPFDDGTACFLDACSPDAACTAGVCTSPLAPNVFAEDFSDNAAGWELGTNWEIGAAKLSNCSSGNDPASDHTPTDDNGLAGVLLGGCTPAVLHDFYCITSPVIDLSGVDGNAYLSYWRWLTSDYTPYMQNRVEVFNGNAWNTVFQTEGSPRVNDLAWQFLSHDVTAYKNAMFRARWCYKIGNAAIFTVGGWNLDDVAVGPNTCG